MDLRRLRPPALFALVAAASRRCCCPIPLPTSLTYLALWVGTAAVSVILIGIETVARTHRIHSGLADEMIRAATEQFIPAGIVGALLSVVLFHSAPDALWMLPGLWQILSASGSSPPAARCREHAAAAVGISRQAWRLWRSGGPLVAVGHGCPSASDNS